LSPKASGCRIDFCSNFAAFALNGDGDGAAGGFNDVGAGAVGQQKLLPDEIDNFQQYRRGLRQRRE
jgi:hypothetical protein